MLHDHLSCSWVGAVQMARLSERRLCAAQWGNVLLAGKRDCLPTKLLIAHFPLHCLQPKCWLLTCCRKRKRSISVHWCDEEWVRERRREGSEGKVVWGLELLAGTECPVPHITLYILSAHSMWSLLSGFWMKWQVKKLLYLVFSKTKS